MEREPWGWTVQDLRRLIRNEVAESTHLEYKVGAALARTEKAKDEISKDVSAFANADGGTLVYGIREENHKPVEFDGVDEAATDREWLEQVISSRIYPRIEGLRVRPISLGNGKVALLVWIPQTERGPHQAADMKFYARRNFIVQPMEEHEIRDVYQRRRSPDILLDFFFRRLGARVERFPISWVNPETLHHLELNAEIRNEGGGSVSEALVTLVLDARLLADEAHLPIPFRELTLSVQGRQVAVKHAQIPWRGPKGLSLFKSVAYRLLENDQPISFKKDWVEGYPPFVLWDVRAPDMMPKIGFLRLRRNQDDVALLPDDPSGIGGFTQDDHHRQFLGRPDLSVGRSGTDG